MWKFQKLFYLTRKVRFNYYFYNHYYKLDHFRLYIYPAQAIRCKLDGIKYIEEIYSKQLRWWPKVITLVNEYWNEFCDVFIEKGDNGEIGHTAVERRQISKSIEQDFNNHR